MPQTRAGVPFALGSDTSYEAALHAAKFVSAQGIKVYTWLKAQGSQGGTRKEAESALGMKTQSLCARLKALEEAHAIAKVDGRKRDGCAVYRVIGRQPEQLALWG